MQGSNTIELVDNHGRKINYLRIGITDKCNLRCIYCMPEKGLNFLPENELLDFSEIQRIIKISTELGIKKLRLTGGEPFVRPGFIEFLKEIAKIKDLEICITTNALLAYEHLDELLNLGILHLNISLDSLDPDNFKNITRRDKFEPTMLAIHSMIEKGFNLKINTVLMEGKNNHEIPDFIEFAKKYPVEVRFIEEMPFNGKGDLKGSFPCSEEMIKKSIENSCQSIYSLPFNHGDTAKMFSSKEWLGKIGIIGAYSRSFCGACNRLRITPAGQIKNCLYDSGVFNLKEFMREGNSNQVIKNKIVEIVGKRYINGFEAEKNRNIKLSESMTTIGG